MQTTQVTRNDRHNQNISPRTGSTRYYAGAPYRGTRSYTSRQYSGTRYYGGTRYYYGWTVLKVGLWHIRGVLPVLVFGRLSVQGLQQLLLVLHAYVRL